jgi:hypothetical protein
MATRPARSSAPSGAARTPDRMPRPLMNAIETDGDSGPSGSPARFADPQKSPVRQMVFTNVPDADSEHANGYSSGVLTSTLTARQSGAERKVAIPTDHADIVPARIAARHLGATFQVHGVRQPVTAWLLACPHEEGRNVAIAAATTATPRGETNVISVLPTVGRELTPGSQSGMTQSSIANARANRADRNRKVTRAWHCFQLPVAIGGSPRESPGRAPPGYLRASPPGLVLE